MLAIIAPGQGSQSPGMLSSWIQDPALRDLVISWSDSIGLDLLHLGTAATADEIKDTANAQPLIVATSLLGAHALKIKSFSIASGHSVGELTAAAISGAISQEQALAMVRIRGTEMSKAAATSPTGMSAVLGGERTHVLAAIESLGLVAANDNGAGQIVAAGELDALAQLAENPPIGSRVRALAVAGAFHTHFMTAAIKPFEQFTQTISTSPVLVSVISNKDGAVISQPDQLIDRITTQIANPVRWDLCMQRLKTLGVTGVIELPPAGTLVGLLKRAVPEIETFALKNAEDLLAAHEFVERHA